jgi:hypothetical protein
MNRPAIQKRLAETEERIALGQRQVAQQQDLIVKLEADEIAGPCKILAGWA